MLNRDKSYHYTIGIIGGLFVMVELLDEKYDFFKSFYCYASNNNVTYFFSLLDFYYAKSETYVLFA
jgi:hypothetical protein